MGVALFMGGGSSTKKDEGTDGDGGDGSSGADTMLLGVLMLSVSLCFDGATGAYEDKLMGNDHIGPFDLMYNIQVAMSLLLPALPANSLYFTLTDQPSNPFTNQPKTSSERQ